MSVNGHSFQIYAAPAKADMAFNATVIAPSQDGAQAGIDAAVEEIYQRGGYIEFTNPRGADGRWIATGNGLVSWGEEKCCAILQRLSVGQESAAS